MTLLITKRCRGCGEHKSSGDFHRHNKTLDGLQPRCKTCALAAARVSYRKNRDEKLAYARSWARANPEKVRQARYRNQLKRYDLTLEEYEERLRTQQYACAICTATDPGRGRTRFCVDHDHATGAVRGLLCMDCNDGLGRFRDNPDFLRSAGRYLGGDF